MAFPCLGYVSHVVVARARACVCVCVCVCERVLCGSCAYGAFLDPKEFTMTIWIAIRFSIEVNGIQPIRITHA